ncbi:MAG: DNA repair protein RecO [Bacilli bacterium]|nr:DNA repair protein RecO [Bacilli bacterium]
MKIVEIEGIVLSETKYGETSKILNVLTKEYGKIGIISKGCRTMKSKLKGVSNRLVYGKFIIYYKEKGLSNLISVDVYNSFRNILTNIDKISYATCILELVDQIIRQAEDIEIYDLLELGLLKIEEGCDPEIINDIVEIKALEYLGVSPDVDACCVCGSDKQIITINVSRGGYVCRNCFKNEKIFDEKTIKLIRLFNYIELEKITKIEVSDKIKKELSEFIDEYYDKYTGIFLKSKKIIKNIKKIG